MGGGPQQIQLRTEDKENGDMGAVAPLVRGSEGSCNLVQEISFHMVNFFLIFGTLCLRDVMPWREKKYHCGGHRWRGGLFTQQLKK